MRGRPLRQALSLACVGFPPFAPHEEQMSHRESGDGGGRRGNGLLCVLPQIVMLTIAPRQATKLELFSAEQTVSHDLPLLSVVLVEFACY